MLTSAGLQVASCRAPKCCLAELALTSAGLQLASCRAPGADSPAAATPRKGAEIVHALHS